MKPIKISDIVIGDDRQRREFDMQALADLSQSIQSKGLLHAPVCRINAQGETVLVAGERRLRAMQMLIDLDIPIIFNETAYLAGTVPVVYISELSDVDAFEAELEENILRQDLTWQERAQATSKLHELRKAQGAGIQTFTATASEISGRPATSQDVAKVREDVIVAKFLNDPEVAKAATKREAIKVIERKLKAEHREVLSQQFDLTQTPHELRNGDFFELVRDVPDESIDCILTDPPYGVDASKFGNNFSTTHNYEDSWESFCRISAVLARESLRILKPDAHAYVFCSLEGWIQLAHDFRSVGLRVWPQPLIWSKGNGNAPWLTEGHKRTYECILFATRGHRQVNVVKNDVLLYSPVSDREHGAEKPVELLVDLLGRSTLPGQRIFDGFAGSGSIFPAATLANCTAIAFEKDRESYNIALTKLMEPIL